MHRFFTAFFLCGMFVAGAQSQVITDLKLRIVSASSTPLVIAGSNLHINLVVSNQGNANLRAQDSLHFIPFIGNYMVVDQSGQPVTAVANQNILAGDSAAFGLDFYLPQGMPVSSAPLCLSMLTPTVADTNTLNNTSCGNFVAGTAVGLEEDQAGAKLMQTPQGPLFEAGEAAGTLRCYNLQGKLLVERTTEAHQQLLLAPYCPVAGVYVVQFETARSVSARSFWVAGQGQ